MSASPSKRTWKQNPEQVKQDILAVALEEFAENGFSGARINVIAEKTKTSKRMLYYYFEDKRGLYREALALAYRQMREQEQRLDVAGMSATAALIQLVEFTFNDRINHDAFMRLVSIENIHRAEHLAEFPRFREINKPAVERVAEIYDKGVSSGEFSAGCDPLALHWFISALATFNVTNRHTFATAFGDRLFSPAGQAILCQMAVSAVLEVARHGDRFGQLEDIQGPASC